MALAKLGKKECYILNSLMVDWSINKKLGGLPNIRNTMTLLCKFGLISKSSLNSISFETSPTYFQIKVVEIVLYCNKCNNLIVSKHLFRKLFNKIWNNKIIRWKCKLQNSLHNRPVDGNLMIAPMSISYKLKLSRYKKIQWKMTPPKMTSSGF